MGFVTRSSPPLPSNAPPDGVIFDRKLVRRRRDRAAATYASFAFLKDRVVEDVLDRLSTVNRTFSRVLDLGAHDGRFATALAHRPDLKDRFGTVFSADLSPTFAQRAPAPAFAADEALLPIRDGAFDLVVSCLSLHWVNDLPGTMIQIRRALKPDGLFIGAQFGGRTLNELRTCLLEAESEQTGGAAPRVSPFAETVDIAALLQRAGFALPVADIERYPVRYANPARLLDDLKGMGETNALVARAPKALARTTLIRALQLYEERFADAEGKCPATFDVVVATGWAPHESQQKPLRPGSAKTRLADALGVEEQSAGEKAPGGSGASKLPPARG